MKYQAQSIIPAYALANKTFIQMPVTKKLKQ